MRARVIVPIRVRLAARDLDPDAGGVAVMEATRVAVDRALSRARTVDALAGASAMAPPPAFTWTGAGLEDAPAPLRRAFEARVARLLEEALAAVSPPARARGATPLGEPVVEAAGVDDVPAARVEAVAIAATGDPDAPDLLAAAARDVPSYDSGGTPVAVPTEGAAGARAREPRLVMPVFQTPEAVLAAIRARIDSGEIAVPAAGLLGIVYRFNVAGRDALAVAVFRFPGGDAVADFVVPPLKRLGAPAAGSTTPELEPVTGVSQASFRLRPLGRASTTEARAALIGRVLGPDLRRALRGAAAPATEALERAVERAARGLAERIDAAWFALLKVGHDRFLIQLPNAAGPRLTQGRDLDLVPLVDLAPAARGAVAGGSGGAGAPPCRGPDSAGRDPFQCEPPVADYGDAGRRAASLMDEIAAELSLARGDYGGALLVAAAAAIARRAYVVAGQAMAEAAGAGTLSSSPDAAALGRVSVVFAPAMSAALADLRRMAGIVPKLTELRQQLFALVDLPGNAARIGGFRWNNATGWQLDLLIELHSSVSQAVAELFAGACRIIYMQLLATSRAEIERRLRPGAFDEFAALFAALALPGEGGQRSPLEAIEQLERLRGQLRAALPAGALERVGEAVFSTWRAAHRAVEDALDPPAPSADAHAPPEGGLVSGAQGGTRISDGTRTYTLDQLETAIGARRAVIESVDPLVRQISSIPDLMARVRGNRAELDRRLRALLVEMRDKNTEQARLTREDARHAFEASAIVEQIRTPTVRGSRYAMQGVHGHAHEALGPAFAGDSYYASGIDYLFGSLEGRRGLVGALEMAGLLVLAVFCAPAALVLGGAAALYHLSEAQRQRGAYRALIDPGDVFRRGDLEAELFAAELGAALNFLPVAGRLLRGPARAVGRAGARLVPGAGREAIARAGGALGRAARLPGRVLEELKADYVNALFIEYAINEVQDRVLGALLTGPAIARLEAEFEATGPHAGARPAMGGAR